MIFGCRLGMCFGTLDHMIENDTADTAANNKMLLTLQHASKYIPFLKCILLREKKYSKLRQKTMATWSHPVPSESLAYWFGRDQDGSGLAGVLVWEGPGWIWVRKAIVAALHPTTADDHTVTRRRLRRSVSIGTDVSETPYTYFLHLRAECSAWTDPGSAGASRTRSTDLPP